MAPKIRAEEAELDFSRPADELGRQVRALDPAPGAYTSLGGARLKVWRAVSVDGSGDRPGLVAAVGPEGIDVQTPRGRLRLQEVQAEGKRRMRAEEFVRGRAVSEGDLLGR